MIEESNHKSLREVPIMNDQPDQEEFEEIVEEISLEFLIQDIIQIGKDFMLILKELLNIDEYYEDESNLDTQGDDDVDANGG